MKIQSCSLSADALKGAIVSNNKGDEIGRIVDIEFDLDRHEVNVMLWQEDTGLSGIPWNSMWDFRISLQSTSWVDNADRIAGKVAEAVEYIVENK
jgi:sporulation protein YlmC with PRC-barrel domain